jgi:hypothetical protein
VQLLTKKFSAIEGSPLLFEFNRPIQVVSLEKIKILNKDSVRLLPEQLTYKIDEKNPTLVGIYYPWKTGENYSLELFRNAFIDAYNQTHVILQSNFIVGEDKSSQLASITLKVDLSNISEQNKSPQYIIELLKSDKNIVVLDQKIIQDSENFVFDKMPEGNYRLRITMDKNKNARWDTGDYEEKIQPERIYYYPDEIVIKANFTQEIDWIIKL